MTRTRKLLRFLLPERLFADIERESRRWHMRCGCGWEISVWDAGGLRYKATRGKKEPGRCPQCRKWTWFNVYLKE